MIKYGTRELDVEYGSISYAKKTAKVIRHYPMTDQSVSHDLGRDATRIVMSVIIDGATNRIMFEQMIHSNIERNLIINNEYYKRVICDTEYAMKPMLETSEEVWTCAVTFIALDPIPYDVTTGEALY